MINLAPFSPGTPDENRYDPKNEATFRRELGAWAKLVWAALTNGTEAKSYSNASRPAFGRPGRVVFNTDSGKLNVDTGTGWTLPDGTPA